MTRRRARKEQRPAAPQPVQRRRLSRRLLVWLSAGLLVLLGAAGWFLWPRDTAPEPPAVAFEGMDPEVAAAIEQARASVRRTPRDGRAWGHLGMVLFANGARAEARISLAHAERFAAHEGRWSYLLAHLVFPEDPEAGRRHLERAVERCDDPIPQLWLGELLLEQGRLEEADGHFRRALGRQPWQPRTHLGLAQVAYRRGDLPRALEHLRQAAAAAPEARAVRALLAEIHYRQGDEQAAAAELRRLDRLPEHQRWPDPYLDGLEDLVVGLRGRVGRAQQLLKKGQAGDALALLQQTARNYPDSFDAHLALGRFWLQAGNLRAAEQALREAARLKPGASNVDFDLGVALERQEDYAGAADCFRKAIRLQPYDAQAHFHLGQCLKQQADLTGALAAFRAAVRCEPSFAEGYRALGELLAQLGQRAEALAAAEQAVRLAPSDEQARELLDRLRRHVRTQSP